MYVIENSLIVDERGFAPIIPTDAYPLNLHHNVEDYCKTPDAKNNCWFTVRSDGKVESGELSITQNVIIESLHRHSNVHVYKVSEHQFLLYIAKEFIETSKREMLTDMLSSFSQSYNTKHPIVFNPILNEIYFITDNMDVSILSKICSYDASNFVSIISNIDNINSSKLPKLNTIVLDWYNKSYITDNCKLYEYIHKNGMKCFDKIVNNIGYMYHIIPVDKTVPLGNLFNTLLEEFNIIPCEKYVASLIKFYSQNYTSCILYIDSDYDIDIEESVFIFIDANLDDYSEIINNLEFILGMINYDRRIEMHALHNIAVSDFMSVEMLFNCVNKYKETE